MFIIWMKLFAKTLILLSSFVSKPNQTKQELLQPTFHGLLNIVMGAGNLIARSLSS